MSAQKKSSFAKLFVELEAITAWFESDSIDLEEGLEKFERGMVIAKELRERLQSVEVRIEEVRKKFDEDVS